MPFPHKNIRLHSTKYVGQCSYFVTISCARKLPIFANSKNSIWLIENLREQSIAYRFAVHAYCVMPDHFHGLVGGLKSTSDLLAFIKTLKQKTGYEYQRKTHRVLWQKKFHEHILRERDNAASIAGYIWMNPVRKGLCTDPREYPYSGSFTTDWKRTISPVESWVPDWKSGSKAPA
jgi:putative transposase